jgi:D-amino peptidase
MKLLIAADMEGINGVVSWDQVRPGHPEYERFRRLMTAEVNAAISAAAEAGADEIVVSDGHNAAANLLIEELDPHARLNTGSPSPFAMIQGIDQGVNAVIFIGYHARSGQPGAVLSHTWDKNTIANLWLNGQRVGEIGLNAALCGHFNAPVIMIAGDQAACKEASSLLGDIETVAVKQASGRYAAECLPLSVSQARIKDAARRSVSACLAGRSPAPLKLQTPIEMLIEFFGPEMADRAALLPGSSRQEGKQILFRANDMPGAYQAFRAAVVLAGA